MSERPTAPAGRVTGRGPRLQVRGARRAEAVVLLLPGGKATSERAMEPWDLARLRMLPFGWQVSAESRGRVAVAGVRYTVRGWNDERQSPVPDALWALDQVRRRFPGLPIGLLGHSMGGRTALHVAGEQGVHSVLALAPWLPGEEPIAQLTGRRVLIAHGTADRVTSAAASRAYAARARAAGMDVTYRELPGLEHTMLRGALRWQRLATDFALATLLPPARQRR